MKKGTYIRTGSLLIVSGCNLALSTNDIFSQDRPNVVIILSDDQNKNTVGCYTSGIPTPNIDRLAENGMKFTNANVVASVSSPSRYSILTGRYYNSNYSEEFLTEYPEGTVSCFGNACYLEKDGNNIAGILQKAGYRTGFTGKFHLTQHEYLTTNRKWDEVGLQTYPHDSDPRTDPDTDRKMRENHQWWCEQIKPFGFDYVNGVYSANLRETFNQYTNAHNVEWTMDAALEFLDDQKGQSSPFLLVMATTYPHGPAPQTVENGKFVNSIDNPVVLTGEGVREDLLKYSGDRKKVLEAYSELTENNPDMPQTAATAMWWDNAVGRVVDKLTELGVEENTIIVYMSDHGILKGSKATLYDDGTNIPFIMQWKKGIPAGKTYDHVIGSVDLVPTLLELCGVEPSDRKIDGISFVSAFADQDKPVRDALLMELGYARAIKTDEFKYIAIRYPENPKTETDPVSGLPYIMKHSQLSKKAARARANYFLPDQVYEYRSDASESHNLFGKDPARDKSLQDLMARELMKYSGRPFGEFNQ